MPAAPLRDAGSHPYATRATPARTVRRSLSPPDNPMARTPLFRELARALRLARHSLDTGTPPDEVVELYRERRTVSRREFMGVSAAAAGALFVQGCAPFLRVPPLPPRGGEEPVLIVGAGIAGLIAGYRLRQAGVPVRIMEAQNRVGGRMYSLRGFFPDGQVAELGGELIDTGHAHVRALAGELEIPLDDLSEDERALARDVWYFNGRRYTDREVVEAFRPLAERITRDTKEVDDPTYDDPAGGRALDHTSLRAWLDGAGVSGWFRELLDVAYTTEYGLETEEQSALNFLLMIDPEPEPFRIFGESDERFHVRGGNDLITTTLAERLHGSIELGTVLEAVAARGDGGFTATFRRGGTSFDVAAQHLLLAIPFTLLREVRLDVPLGEVKRRAIRELGYGTNAKLMVGFSERVWRDPHRSNGSVLTDLPFQLTWETSRLQPGDSGILTNFTGGRHGVELGRGTPGEQAALFTHDLERVFPGAAAARNGLEARFHWPSFPWTRGSYACYRPGQWTGIRGVEGKNEGRLFFAGEHTSLGAQGFMEGGCETGERAAREILRSLGAGIPGPVRRRAPEPVAVPA